MICDLRFSICDVRFAICDVRCAICDLRCVICELRCAMCDLRFAILRKKSKIENRKSKIKKPLFTAFFLCPGQDSNLHTLASTSPSSWRVYQFHHLGGSGAELRTQDVMLMLCALCTALCAVFCAQNRTRTCTSLLTLVPETSASTNFAIWAIISQKSKVKFDLFCLAPFIL